VINLKKKSKAIINYIYSSFYQIFLIIIPLITAPYLARTLLPEAVGINSYVCSVINIVVLLGLIGLNNYSLREIAYVRDDKKKLSKTFSELLVLRIICFAVTTIIYLIFSITSQYRFYFLIASLNIVSSFIEIAWLYQGFEEFKVTVTRNFIVKILNVASIFIFIKGPEDLGLFIFLSAIFSVLANAALYFGVKEKIGKLTFKNLDLKRHLIPTLKLFLPQVASLIFLQCDKIMIKFLAEDISHVGFYDQAERIIKMPLALITALSVVMLPRISNEFKNKNMDTVKTYITKAFNFSLMMAIPLMFGLAAIAGTMIPWFLGKGYEEVANIMFVLAPIVLFISMSSVSGNQYLTAVDKTKILTISCVAGAIVNIIFNAIFIPMFNSVGAAIGTVGAELTVIIIQLINIKEVVRFRDLLKLSIKYLIAGIAMFVVCFLIGNKLGSSIVSTLIQICSGGAIYFIILLILRDSFLKECIEKALNIVKEKFMKKR